MGEGIKNNMQRLKTCKWAERMREEQALPERNAHQGPERRGLLRKECSLRPREERFGDSMGCE